MRINDFLKFKPYFITFFVFSMIFFAPRFHGVNFSLLFVFFTSLLYIWNRLQEQALLREFLASSFFEKALLYFMLYAFVLYVIEGVTDFQNHGYYFFKISRSLGVFITYKLLQKDYNLSIQAIVLGAVIAIFMQIMVVIGQYFTSGTLQYIFLSLNTLTPPSPEVVADTVVRVRGLMKGYDGASLLIGSLSVPLLFYTRNKLLKFTGILALLLVLIIVGRMGIALLVFSLMSYFIYKFCIMKHKGVITTVIVSLAVIFSIVHISKSINRDYQDPIYRTLELVCNITQMGILFTSSTNDLLRNHLTLKNIRDPAIYILGKASAQSSLQGLNILSSDVGYIHLLYNFGVLNLFIFLLILITTGFNINTPKTKFIYYCALLSLMVTSLKGPYFFSRGFFDLYLLVVFFSIYCKQLCTTFRIDIKSDLQYEQKRNCAPF